MLPAVHPKHNAANNARHLQSQNVSSRPDRQAPHKQDSQAPQASLTLL
ncbi:Uncharacterised protein [Vibrio cholerae]|uniref:Uncharacterized protein n=1 Tax=Vibrio cholerae TaxID=666 RepID=A0A656AQZ3_VIBCL|nr:Uncharacterised protein [Vibrio cholerae]CSD28042.1 Uncharacterised protein [Vibrio cholerae]